MKNRPSPLVGEGFCLLHRNTGGNCSKITKFTGKFSISACGMGVDFSEPFRLYLCVGQNMTRSTGRTFGKDTRRPCADQRQGFRAHRKSAVYLFFHDIPFGGRHERNEPDADLWKMPFALASRQTYSTLLSS